MDRIYLDWAATSAPDANIIREAAELSLDTFGNPSSPHQRGKDAAALLDTSRKRIADCFGTEAERLFFTSGGTDSNNIILTSLLYKKKPGNLVISGIEHSSIFEAAVTLEQFGWEVRIVDPEENGIVSAEKFCSRIDNETRLASILMINNETGAVQPVTEIGKIISGFERIHFHIDAVQAAGKYPLELSKLPVDSASISSHKFQGPRGSGLLYLKKIPEMLYSGGGQEKGIRHGTENNFAVAATASATEKSTSQIDHNMEHALKLKSILIDRISDIRGAVFIPHCSRKDLLNPELFSPYILSVSIKPVPGEILVRVISDKGFDIATGSACATGKKKKSRVMSSMGITPEEAFSTVRISTGCDTSIEEIGQFCDTFKAESSILSKSLRR